MSVFGVDVIFRESSGVNVTALAYNCCRAAPDSLLLLIHYLCYNVSPEKELAEHHLPGGDGYETVDEEGVNSALLVNWARTWPSEL